MLGLLALGLSLSACNQIRDFRGWLQSSVGVKREAPEETIQPLPKTSRCCWCKKEGTLDNVVRVYSPDSPCSDPTGQLTDCKVVSVDGDRCSLVSVQDTGDRLACAKVSLFYHVGEEKFEITPPPGPVFPCDASKLMEAQAEGPVKITDAYCTCGRDPQNEKNCALSLVDGGRTTLLESRPRPDNQAQCHSQLCFDFFLEKYKNICPPRYVQGNL